MVDITNRRWDEDYFLRKRREILAFWPTAGEIDLGEAVEYFRALPDAKKWVQSLAAAGKQGRVPVGAMIGKTSVEETVENARALEENGADFFWLLPDTYSRRARYAEAEKALQESLRLGRSLLNGFPIVNHGLGKARQVREAIGVPVLFVDSDTESCMLLTEMALAAGFARASHDVESVLRTSKNYPLEQKIRDGQYQNRLAGYYTERGAPVEVLIHNNLCGIDPPEMKVALGVLHSLLIAEQGVRHVSQEASLSCCFLQDVAALRVAKEMTAEYLARSGYDVGVSLTCFPFSGLWPRNRDDAAGVCAWNAVIAILAGTDWFVVKSLDEGRTVPGKEANIAAVRLAKRIMAASANRRLGYSKELALEKEMVRLAATAIVEKTLELGDGDAAVGQVRAVEQGVIDTAFSPYCGAKGAVMPMRDVTGAVRYLKHGNIPLPQEVVDYHEARTAERRTASPGRPLTELVVEDIYSISGR